MTDQDIVTSGGTLASSLDSLSLSKQRTLLWRLSIKYNLKRKCKVLRWVKNNMGDGKRDVLVELSYKPYKKGSLLPWF